ncbi:WD40-repeat-containing domain protein [Thamnocephalis sphaerospora]|uniref:WD40-repeat-containing domain protein n=1 Tax=Thamnocephalis sphaerospora TaxID=78915 RepID=A0A4P9XLY5_9FUNG|nr:WD40-repeat-containing domain protein [Thamnocephalis sphaerospora]|eukprot:RKP06894.1 WD40-repeat-containing domain protein [Thamnocephalis sphaerospora]
MVTTEAAAGKAGSSGVSTQTAVTPGGFRREELVRLMLQSLQELGYSGTAQLLETESGFCAEDAVAAQFRQCVMSGDWDHAEQLLPAVDYDMAHARAGRFQIRRQKYLEYLEQRHVKQALTVLRQELTPLNYNHDQLHLLSSLLMSAPADLYRRADWDGARGTSRATLLRSLQQHITPTRMIPTGRLEILLQQAVRDQARSCLYHNALDQDISLFVDHLCDRRNLPGTTTRVLKDHTDEVWSVTFSHDGRYLASASQDRTSIVWDVETGRQKLTLSGHFNGITHVAWSHDDKRLLTCSSDKQARVWNAQTGVCEIVLDAHKESVTSGAWLPDGSFVTGSLDKSIYLWSSEGVKKHRWPDARINDLDVSRDGTRMVAVCQEKRIRVYDIPSRAQINEIKLSQNISSVVLSADARYALVNLSSESIHIWDLDNSKLVRRYNGHAQERFVIRSCFGGIDEGLVASGSEDNSVYLWHRDSEKLIAELSGHEMAVNDISWHPHDPCVFASASDDHTIRL